MGTRSAILIIGNKLPIGMRTVKMLDHSIELVDKRARRPNLYASPTTTTATATIREKIPLVKVAHTWIGADVIDKALEE